MDWRTILIPPDMATAHPAPDRAQEATTPDNRRIQAIVWGSGTAASPFHVLVRLARIAPEHVEEWEPVGPELRQPTLEEIQEAITQMLPAGCIMALGHMESGADPFKGRPMAEAEWTGAPLSQVGHTGGSEAARSGIIMEGGRHAH